jgi:opacity protein-like surface antigen
MRNVFFGSLVFVSLVAGSSAFADETVPSNEDLLQRLTAIENINARLEKENASLRGQVSHLKNSKQVEKTEPGRHSVPVSTAASMPRSAMAAYDAAPVPIFNWTGFYVGVQSGYGWARLPPLDGAPSPSGWFGGGQLGFNYQLASNFVVGTEIDAAFASLKDTTISLDTVPAKTVSTAGTIDFLGSIRARAGYADDRIFI